jgi:hypothetical protein
VTGSGDGISLSLDAIIPLLIRYCRSDNADGRFSPDQQRQEPRLTE